MLDDDFLYDFKSSNDDDDDTPILVKEYKLGNMPTTIHQKREPSNLVDYSTSVSKDASVNTSARGLNKKSAPKPILLASIQTSSSTSTLPPTFLCGASEPLPNKNNNNADFKAPHNSANRRYWTNDNFMNNSTQNKMYPNVRNRSVLDEEKHCNDVDQYKKLLETLAPRLYGKNETNVRSSGGGDPPANCIGSPKIKQTCLNIHSLSRNAQHFNEEKSYYGKLPDQRQSDKESKVHFISDRVPKILPKFRSTRATICDDDNDVTFNGEYEADRQMAAPSASISKDDHQKFGWTHWRTSSSNNYPCVVQIDDDDDDDAVKNRCRDSVFRKMNKPYFPRKEPVIDLCKEPDNNFAMPRKPTM